MQKAQMVRKYRQALEKLYDHTVTISEMVTEFNPETYRTEPVEKIIYKDLPCRISFVSQETVMGEDISLSSKKVKLFIGPEIKIKDSSKIVANVNDNIIEFELSSPAFIYPTHREYILSYKDEIN